MIGGTTWKIMKDDEEEYVYCVDVNHKRETHLNGIQLDAFDKPTLMITDCSTYGYQQERRAKRRERKIKRMTARATSEVCHQNAVKQISPRTSGGHFTARSWSPCSGATSTTRAISSLTMRMVRMPSSTQTLRRPIMKSLCIDAGSRQET